MKFYITVIMAIIMVTNAHAEPFLPARAGMVLAQVPLQLLPSESRTIQQLKIRLKNDPDDHDIAYELANAYLTIARNQGDPRYYGLAESVMRPWWDEHQYTNLMLLKAKILEYNHDFTQALVVLDSLIDNQHSTQAILMRANIHQITGNYDKVRQDCKGLLFKTSSLVTAGCFFSVNGFSSSPDQTRRLITQLKSILETTKSPPLQIQLWIIGLLAEAASLNNDWSLSEEILLSGLKVKRNDGYLLSLYADLLLKQSRFQDCVDLLSPHIQQTTLLVRLLAAQSRLPGSKAPKKEQNDLDIRIQEDVVKGDQRHLREYAYYQLYVQKNFQAALNSALTNWSKQKELTDTLILYRVAKDLQRKDILSQLQNWLDKSRIQINFSRQSLTL